MKKKSFLTLIMAFAMASLCCLLTARETVGKHTPEPETGEQYLGRRNSHGKPV